MFFLASLTRFVSTAIKANFLCWLMPEKPAHSSIFLEVVWQILFKIFYWVIPIITNKKKRVIYPFIQRHHHFTYLRERKSPLLSGTMQGFIKMQMGLSHVFLRHTPEKFSCSIVKGYAQPKGHEHLIPGSRANWLIPRGSGEMEYSRFTRERARLLHCSQWTTITINAASGQPSRDNRSIGTWAIDYRAAYTELEATHSQSRRESLSSREQFGKLLSMHQWNQHCIESLEARWARAGALSLMRCER